MPSAAEVRALEAVAYEVWLAPEVEELDGWRLRCASGYTGRANSVWPYGAGALSLAERVARAETWYRERGLPAAFQLTHGSTPGLDDELAGRGYRRGEPVSVCTGPLAGVEQADGEVTETLDDDWVSLWAGTRSFERLDIVRTLLSAGRAAFARVGDVAVGRAVAVGEWLGVTSLATLPAARRRGHARTILGSLSRWGLQQGCTQALVQVERGNVASERLCAAAGFVPHHDYWYRVAP